MPENRREHEQLAVKWKNHRQGYLAEIDDLEHLLVAERREAERLRAENEALRTAGDSDASIVRRVYDSGSLCRKCDHMAEDGDCKDCELVKLRREAERLRAENEALRNTGRSAWAQPPCCPKCGAVLVAVVSEYGEWQCNTHADGKRIWFNYELTMILCAQNERLRADNEKQRALAKYAKHEPNCTVSAYWGITDCTCGYSTAHAAAKGDT
jgi:hypothetical protein